MAAAILSSAITASDSEASILGTLGNFDIINDTGETCYGFEIELEGIHSSDVSDVFGGPGRGFPTGRGYDPATAVERYGAPTIEEYTNGLTFGTRITYSAVYDANSMSWDYGTPSGNIVIPSDSCWTRGGIGYGPSTSCDHFGVGTRVTPAKTTYSWLHETSPGVLSGANGVVNLPAPIWQAVVPFPNQPPVVMAAVEAPEPSPAQEFGEAIWVKVFTTELENEPELEDLVGNNPIIEQAETEIEWQLLQKSAEDPNSGKLENDGGGPVGANVESVVRRYEFYKFSGQYDPENHEAIFDAGYGDSNPGPGDVGAYIGAQNAAALLGAAVPEPATCALVLAAIASIGASRASRFHLC